MGNLLTKAKSILSDAKAQWKVPGEGKYVPYKEVASYAVGGAGVYFITSLVGIISLNAGSMIVGASIGLKAMDIQTMNVISTLIMLLIAPTRAMLFDNTKSKMGKFRPYILFLGLPTAILGTVFVYLPYETMQYNQKLISVFVVYTLLQFCSPFYLTAYSSLVQVLSPNSKERSWIIGISSIVYSFAPTVINPVLPLLGPLDDIKTYRIAFPIFCTLGVCVSMLCVFGTKEKTIVPHQYVQKVGFFEGLKKVSKNKYFWIINISSWISFLNMGYSYLFQWVFYYGMNNPAIYSIMTVIKGEASTPGLVLGAPLTNKLGKKKICLMSLSVQAACMALMITCYESYILFFALMFVKDMFGALSIIYLPAIKADIMDYQQYKTGDRLEGFIEQSGVLLGSIITLGTGYAIPMIMGKLGLTNNYSDLFNADFRNPLLKAMIICSFIGTVLSIIPYLFYDLTEEKRSNMVKAFKIRALFSDFKDGKIEDGKLVEAVKEIYAVVEEYEREENERIRQALKIAVDEFEKYKNKDLYMWQMIEEKYKALTTA
ncbi:MAG: MFS transporter [Acutalibacteraceae bacterium]|nr:MFS transporter [Acutalibacteraceae bacterium]